MALFLAIASLITPQTITIVNPEPIIVEQVIATPETVELEGELKRICSCESEQGAWGEPQHYDTDGTVLLGRVNPLDIGACQINLKHWGAVAEELGFDVFDEYDNIRMAEYIYSTQGSQPWYLSEHCWGG